MGDATSSLTDIEVMRYDLYKNLGWSCAVADVDDGDSSDMAKTKKWKVNACGGGLLMIGESRAIDVKHTVVVLLIMFLFLL